MAGTTLAPAPDPSQETGLFWFEANDDPGPVPDVPGPPVAEPEPPDAVAEPAAAAPEPPAPEPPAPEPQRPAAAPVAVVEAPPAPAEPPEYRPAPPLREAAWIPGATVTARRGPATPVPRRSRPDPHRFGAPWLAELPESDPERMRRRRERKAERRRRGERPREATVEADVEAPSARERGRRRRLALPLIGAAIAGCLALVVTGAGSSALRPSSSHSKASRNGGAGPSGLVMVPAPSALARREIPWRYLRLYVKAADEYGLQWTMLAAVGQTESHSGQSVLPGVTSGANSAGATGPAQFETATWERFGVNVDGHGADPYDPADAITAMAAYLKASGAPENWAGALWTYNHSTAYVEQVLALSAKLGQAA